MRAPHGFEVWAPRARRVELDLAGRRLPMPAAASAWYRVQAEAAPGELYGYRLDGGPLRPDPRSASQPEGVHGPSRLIDHDSFAWSDAGWKGRGLEAGLIYELHVGTFSPEGTFAGAISRLDHLVELGVSHVELMPVAEFAGARNWGYDGVDLYAPHHAYGGPDGLKSLVDACHARGLAVLLDVVCNHAGNEGKYLSEFGPYFRRDSASLWGETFNYDGPDSGPIRRFVLELALMWLRDYHVDGLRLDAVHAIVDTSPRHVLEEMAIRVSELAAASGRRLLLIAESDLNDPRLVTPREQCGYGLDAQWIDDFHHALQALLTGERTGYYADFGSIAELATAFREAYVYSGRHSIFRGRPHGRPVGDLSGQRFVAYAQNHDQVGNRAAGERLSQLVGGERLRLAAALVQTAPFVPLLFMGEEWGASTPFLYFTDHGDPDLARATSQGRVREFQGFGWDPGRVPDPQDPETFRRSRLDWGELEREPHRSLLDWHRRLVRLRRRSPELLDGRRDLVQVAEGPGLSLRIQRGQVVVEADFEAGTVQVRPEP